MCAVRPSAKRSPISALHASAFDCVASPNGPDQVWIWLSGELDLAAAPQLRQTLYEVLGSAQTIVLDLRAVTFIDSSGLHLIIEADAQARAGEQQLVLVRGPRQIDRLFALVGVAGRLEVVDVDAVDPPPPDTLAPQRTPPAPLLRT